MKSRRSPVQVGSRFLFESWKLAAGWVTRDFYFNVDTNQAGGGVADLVADAKYPNNPNLSDVAKAVRINNDIAGNNYGARLSAFFTPSTAGSYQFFVYNDDAAQVWLSTDASTAGLQLLVDSPNVQSNFDTSIMGVSGPLVAGQQKPPPILFLPKNPASHLPRGIFVPPPPNRPTP